MDIGLETAEDVRMLERTLSIIEDIANRRSRIFGEDPPRIWRQGTKLDQLLRGLPEPAVDPRLSIKHSLLAASGALEQLGSFCRNEVATTPVVMSSLLRVAVLGGSRVVFVLGPDDPAEKKVNLEVVVRQEHASLNRLYKNAEKFTSLEGLVPPPAVLKDQRNRFTRWNTSDRPMGEAAMLSHMAGIVSAQLAARGAQPATIIAEHISWIFDINSGMAHGYGWPRLVPGTQDLPGHFLADLFMVASVGQLAFELAGEHTESLEME